MTKKQTIFIYSVLLISFILVCIFYPYIVIGIIGLIVLVSVVGVLFFIGMDSFIALWDYFLGDAKSREHFLSGSETIFIHKIFLFFNKLIDNIKK